MPAFLVWGALAAGGILGWAHGLVPAWAGRRSPLAQSKAIARTIAAHSAQMRVKRRLKIRTEAARASLKIMLPTVGCVFPTLWLILLGPAVIVALTLSH